MRGRNTTRGKRRSGDIRRGGRIKRKEAEAGEEGCAEGEGEEYDFVDKNNKTYGTEEKVGVSR